jgi:transcriptional regulator with XRE-family HTH domain
MTANQTVAYNLQLARAEARLTQEQAAELVQQHLGGRVWTKANYSAAERSVTGRRVRQFTADEIMAFAKAFGKDIGFFFKPPLPPDPFRRWPQVVSPPDAPFERLITDVDLADKLVPEPKGWVEDIERGLEGADEQTREQVLQRLESLSSRLVTWAKDREAQRAAEQDAQLSRLEEDEQ